MEGDVMSIQLLCECFNSFSKASGLVANQSKSCMYFGGVPTILRSSSELKKTVCEPVPTITRQNAGKSQIMDSQILKIYRKTTVGKECVNCHPKLLTGDTNRSKKALVAWEKMCRPKSKGGLNITDLSTWNRAALLKHLWNVCMKKDKLWIRFSAEVWGKMLAWIGLAQRVTGWNEELKWTTDHMKGKGLKVMLYRMCITSVVY
uniref:Uncharacterized protein n=2 Tax=Nicotiana TaxID=4085 RepID=A0A1S3Z3E3_TOBAC|nr:PREDICTED: uncharacterized protein LOC104249201 [Nicotiana sylvestris]XP_016458697.1 PREDICTED: uncharacterized protein LOC107782337 [Nicotiana tabacum]